MYNKTALLLFEVSEESTAFYSNQKCVTSFFFSCVILCLWAPVYGTAVHIVPLSLSFSFSPYRLSLLPFG
jgi:hypothetical protein